MHQGRAGGEGEALGRIPGFGELGGFEEMTEIVKRFRLAGGRSLRKRCERRQADDKQIIFEIKDARGTLTYLSGAPSRTIAETPARPQEGHRSLSRGHI